MPDQDLPEPEMIAYQPERPAPEETTRRTRAFREHMDGRRTVRMFSTDPVPRATIEEILATAGTAPSGAHKQPWTFVAIQDDEVKARMREATEAQEKRFYDELLERPKNERAYVILPIGYPADGCQVPDLERKPLDAFVDWR